LPQTLRLAEMTSGGGRPLIAEAKSAVLTALEELRAVCSGAVSRLPHPLSHRAQ
jgi:hypothetical protein